jgi:hypothetical protein
LRFFQHGEYLPQVISNHQDHIQQQPKCYSCRDNYFVRCLSQGDKVVPPPHERPGLIQKVYSKLVHFRVKRTYSLLTPHYHWRGMYVQVWNIIARCEQCDRMRTSFSFWQLMFSPLPIQGMFYRWSCDLVKELPHTSKGNVYIMIMIEHFSKWVELVVMLDKSSHNTSHVFLQ